MVKRVLVIWPLCSKSYGNLLNTRTPFLIPFFGKNCVSKSKRRLCTRVFFSKLVWLCFISRRLAFLVYMYMTMFMLLHVVCDYSYRLSVFQIIFLFFKAFNFKLGYDFISFVKHGITIG